MWNPLETLRRRYTRRRLEAAFVEAVRSARPAVVVKLTREQWDAVWSADCPRECHLPLGGRLAAGPIQGALIKADTVEESTPYTEGWGA